MCEEQLVSIPVGLCPEGQKENKERHEMSGESGLVAAAKMQKAASG